MSLTVHCEAVRWAMAQDARARWDLVLSGQHYGKQGVSLHCGSRGRCGGQASQQGRTRKPMD